MNIYTLRNNAQKNQDKLSGKVKNTEQNWNYIKDLESWGSLEIVDANDSYIEYSLI